MNELSSKVGLFFKSLCLGNASLEEVPLDTSLRSGESLKSLLLRECSKSKVNVLTDFQGKFEVSSDG